MDWHATPHPTRWMAQIAPQPGARIDERLVPVGMCLKRDLSNDRLGSVNGRVQGFWPDCAFGVSEVEFRADEKLRYPTVE